MTAWLLPITEDPWQVFTLDLTLDGEDFHAQVELRWMPAPEQWYVSIWDHSASELLVNMIPLICSYGEINDLLIPFRHLRGGRGLGSLYCIRGTAGPSTPDPAEGDLSEFQIIWGDSL